MATNKIEEFYHHYIKPLTSTERLRLVELIAHDLTAEPNMQKLHEIDRRSRQYREWSEIRGIAPNLLSGEDAQTWVSRTRIESDKRRTNSENKKNE